MNIWKVMNSMFFSFKRTICNTLLCPDIFKIKVSLASSTTFILLLVKDSVIETFGPLVSLNFFIGKDYTPVNNWSANKFYDYKFSCFFLGQWVANINFSFTYIKGQL